jgi:antitoxin component YwqK of YwqJK toxin-antitoxin module
MSYKTYALLAAVGLATFSCQKNDSQNEVISQKYIHKYGYAVSQEEWQEKNYPGQVISSLKNGVTVSATYENGQLHGPCTYTYPNSTTVEKYVLYNEGMPVKEILYGITGMPLQETVQLTQNRNSITFWYQDGVPRSIEEYTQEELIDGQYFTPLNELEAQVKKGKGMRVMRDGSGTLICKDDIEDGFMKKREAFYPSGSPESIAYYQQGKLHGERRSFTPSGEPLAVEEWIQGHLHGKSVYYKNGMKELEITYLFGKKNGWEIHYTDGRTPSHQIAWDNDLKHGPETFFVPDGKKVIWHYAGKEVSQSQFHEMNRLDEMISQSK